MRTGEINNCEKCGASYSTYKIGQEGVNGDYAETWCEAPIFEGKKIKQPKGVCQFCNPKSIFYNEKK